MKDLAPNAQLKAGIDPANPRSLVALIEGDALSNAVMKVPSELWTLDESALRDRAKPTRTDYGLRLALWNELRIASAENRPIPPGRIYAGICSAQHWYQNVLGNPEKLAWLLVPLQEYEQSLEPLLALSTERLFEILNMSIYDTKGNPVPALVKLVLRARDQLEGVLLGNSARPIVGKNLSPFVGAPQQEESMLE